MNLVTSAQYIQKALLSILKKVLLHQSTSCLVSKDGIRGIFALPEAEDLRDVYRKSRFVSPFSVVNSIASM